MTTATWSFDVLARYPEMDRFPGVTSSTVASATIAGLMMKAEGMVTGRLAASFTVPFSDNNVTVGDLVTDAVFIQTQMTRQPEKAKSLLEWFETRIGDLLSGKTSMVTTSGDIAAELAGEPVWSNTMEYHPTFGMSHPMEWAVSSSMQIDEDNARGNYPGVAS